MNNLLSYDDSSLSNCILHQIVNNIKITQNGFIITTIIISTNTSNCGCFCSKWIKKYSKRTNKNLFEKNKQQVQTKSFQRVSSVILKFLKFQFELTSESTMGIQRITIDLFSSFSKWKCLLIHFHPLFISYKIGIEIFSHY